MTIVVPTSDPMTGHSLVGMTSPAAGTHMSVQSEAAMGRPLEAANALVDYFLQSDSVFPQMIETFKITQRIPTVSGLADTDYPNLAELSNSGQTVNISQFSALTTIPLPKGLLEQFSHMQQNCEMGIMPEIGRAWVAIDSFIYLWNYDNGTDVAYYDGLSETIVSVGLVRPRPGVFTSQIKYLLVLSTAIEILLLGITYTEPEDESIASQVLLVPEPIFRVSTDNVVMNVIRGTANGRIFLGGKDGCLYEVVYQAEDGWFSRKCKKVNLSSSAFSFLIPSIFTVSKQEAIIQIEIDEKRHILYLLTDSGTIEVFDLGPDGDAIGRVSTKHLNSIVSEAQSVAPTIELSYFKEIVSISSVDESESIHINLIAVTREGVRLYFTVTPITSPEQRPSYLTLIHIRLPPGFTASFTSQRPTAVHTSLFRRGTLLMVSSQMENKDVLWTISNDSFAFNTELTELFSICSLNAKIWKVAEEIKSVAHKPYHLYPLKNNRTVATEHPLLVTQHLEEPRKFIFLTSQGINIGLKPRIVDQLLQLLVENQGYDNEPVKAFFGLHPGAQGCAIALILACASQSAQDDKVKEWATSAFFHYGGEPQPQTSQFVGQHYSSPITDRHIQQVSTPLSASGQPLFSTPSSPIAHQNAYSTPTDPLSPIGMSDAVTGGPLIHYSNRHNGVYLYFSRIIRPIWTLKAVTSQMTNTTEGPKEMLISNISLSEIKLYDIRLTELKEFLKSNIKFSPNFEENARKSSVKESDVLANERNSLYNLLKLIEHCIEVLGLWKLLVDHQFHAITAFIPVEKQQKLSSITFKELILFNHDMTTLLASALVRRFIEDNLTTDIINRRLQEVCPSIYKNENALHAKAHELVTKARTIANPTDRANQLETALNLCKKIGARINLAAVCDLFQSAQWYEAVVDICLLTAHNRDPQNLALHYYRNGEPMEDQMGFNAFLHRKECYKLLLEIYDRLSQQSKSLLNPRAQNSGQSVLTLEEVKKSSDAMLRHAIQSNDELFHISLYDWMYEHQQSDKLLEIKSAYLESYLKRKTSAFSDSIPLMDLLWMYYERNGHFRAAAHILSKLAERTTKDISLYKRLEYLSRAIVCMKSSDSRPTALMGDPQASAAGEFLHDLEEKLEVARIQLQLLDQIQKLPESPQTRHAVEALNRDLHDITALYEEFADAFNLAECQLAILHCAGHHDPNLIEAIWQNIIDSELRAISSKSAESQKLAICSKVKQLGKLYLSSETFFPIELIVKTLEMRTQNLEVERHWLIAPLLELGVRLTDLLDLYHKLYKSRQFGTSWPRKQIHLLRVIAYLINVFTDNPSAVAFAQRRHFCTKCLDVLSAYLIDLQTMNAEDGDVRRLAFELKGLKAKLERCV